MRYVVGVMGPAKARKKDIDNARVLGELIARREWVLLTGGVMWVSWTPPLKAPKKFPAA